MKHPNHPPSRLFVTVGLLCEVASSYLGKKATALCPSTDLLAARMMLFRNDVSSNPSRRLVFAHGAEVCCSFGHGFFFVWSFVSVKNFQQPHSADLMSATAY